MSLSQHDALFSLVEQLHLKKSNVSIMKLFAAIRHWMINSAWPGMGLFGESYILFSIGTLTPLWKEIYPECFDHTVCKPRLLHSLTYSVVTGVIVGMLVIGYAANFIGRRKGSLLTASLMFGGAVSMVLESFVWASQNSVATLFQSMAISLFFFGIGVGGEYPLSSSLATENARQETSNVNSTNDKQLSLIDGDNAIPNRIDHRGRNIQLVFAMQGMGIWFNSLTLCLLLWVTGQTSQESYQTDTLLAIWRATYSFGALILFIVLVTRYLYLKESKVWEQDRTNRRLDRLDNCDGVLQINESIKPASSTVGAKDATQPHIDFYASLSHAILPQSSTISELSNPTVVVQKDQCEDSNYTHCDGKQPLKYSTTLWGNYGSRLFGVSIAWLLWDVSFYGNKLFQATFLLALTGEGTTLLEFALAATLNSTLALMGYFGAAWLVDNPKLGRVRLQCLGLLATGILFLACGFLFEYLSSGWLVTLYLTCSFVGQLGPNATTFLIPSEIFPTEQRTYCHGISAASGKVGALIAAVLFHFVPGDSDLFLLCGYASFVGCFITLYLIPDVSGLDLEEVDKQWRLTKDGRKQDYQGEANNPKYMSHYEFQKTKNTSEI
jgi:MFS family permease